MRKWLVVYSDANADEPPFGSYTMDAYSIEHASAEAAGWNSIVYPEREVICVCEYGDDEMTASWEIFQEAVIESSIEDEKREGLR